MAVSVVATAPSDGSHLVIGNRTAPVSYSLSTPSKSTTDHSKDIAGISFGAVLMAHTLEIMDL